ncbi:hypothetical protein D7Z54_19725 [Salibacterium salarium]|uniref:Ferric iron reductase protein FhuF, involved in iron transport n=1 Tax=Salibacterium salarium TaxID=284579 RepID=A0A428N025_9BACI|nr:hypothetical protein [Salibacterium salarium]RSL31672.1 hypothetical protein D7Z54_19725 [Salibacterium salarium]
MAVVMTNHADSKAYELFSVRMEPPVAYNMKHSAESWLLQENLSDFLTQYGRYMDAPSLDMPAMFWANRYSRYFAFVHWAIAKGYELDTAPENVMVYNCERPGIAEPAFEFQTSYSKAHREFETKEERQQRLLSFYQNHVVPLFQAAASYVGIRTRELWGQVYHAVPYFIDLAKVTESNEVQSFLEEDWEYITTQTNPGDFEEKKHPFQYKCIAIPNPVDDDKPLYTKPTCCLAYKGSNRYCYRCPRMKPEQRDEYYQKYKE